MRIHTHQNIKNKVIKLHGKEFFLKEKNKTLVKALKKNIIPYSAINKIANLPPPYSVLNPETSSDSPSEKSKGVRLVSLMQENSHKKKIILR